MLRRALLAAAIALATITIASDAFAGVASDQPGAILVFPKLIVDTTIPASTPRGRIDSLIRISNTSDSPVTLKCFYVNANGHCRANPTTICDPYNPSTPSPCATDDFCIPGWQETDFLVNITARQPIAWLASQGSTLCDQSLDPTVPCLPLGDSRSGFGGQTNKDSRVPPVPENPFVGHLKCIAVDRNEVPVDRNVLKGEVEIVLSDTNEFDVRGYNAIGIRAIEGANDGDGTLVIGGSGQCLQGSRTGQRCSVAADCPGGECLQPEYEGCPNVLILDHFFEGANDPVSGDRINSVLTLVPCSEDYERQAPVEAPIQFLVFNEFEQRFSTSRIINCFHEFRLFDIDGATPGDVRSIFSAAVNGTLTGQTRMRGVAGDNPRVGYTWLGLAEEFRENAGSAAYNIHFHGARPQSDFIHLP